MGESAAATEYAVRYGTGFIGPVMSLDACRTVIRDKDISGTGAKTVRREVGPWEDFDHSL
jgi:hypothetical protein